MSRIGREPIPIPPGVAVNIKDSMLTVSGPKGKLSYVFHPQMSVSIKDNQIIVRRPSEERLYRSLHGTTRTLIANMVEGVVKGYEKVLEIKGTGYRASKKGEGIVLQLGFSHPVEFYPPQGIVLEVEGTTKIKVKGIDKAVVGNVAARIRDISPPNPYTGKGIRYADEVVRLKPGKAGKVAKKAK